MKGSNYIPDVGDIVWIDFDPQAGREQKGRRPALILTPSKYNRATDLALVCPITSQVKGYSFEVALPPASAIIGVVLSDHIKSLDWRVRRVKFACQVQPEILAEVRARISALLRPRA